MDRQLANTKPRFAPTKTEYWAAGSETKGRLRRSDSKTDPEEEIFARNATVCQITIGTPYTHTEPLALRTKRVL